MAINQDWKQIKTPDEIILVASPQKKQSGSFLGFASSTYQSPIYKFKPNSIVRLRGGRVYFDTNDLVQTKKKHKAQRKKKRDR